MLFNDCTAKVLSALINNEAPDRPLIRINNTDNMLDEFPLEEQNARLPISGKFYKIHAEKAEYGSFFSPLHFVAFAQANKLQYLRSASQAAVHLSGGPYTQQLLLLATTGRWQLHWILPQHSKPISRWQLVGTGK